jgi:hypothetical protein
MKLIPIAFDSETSPWRVILPTALTHGKRKAKYFATKKDAEGFCKIANKPGFTLDGFVPAIPKSEQDEFAVAIKRFAALYDGKISNAYAAHEKLKKLQNIKPATVREASALFMAARQAGWSPKGRPPGKSTIESDRCRLYFFEDRFSATQLSDLGEVELRTFFDEINNDNKKSIRKSLSVFYTWAMRYKYVGENPISLIDSKEFGQYGVNNEYYPVATFGRMLRIAAGLEPVRPGQAPTRDFIDMLPYFILGGFAGLRRCEALRVDRGADAIRWTDLHFDAEIPNIEIREAVAKRTARQSDLHYIDADYALESVQAWLPLCPQNSPLICRWTQRYMQELKRRFTKATGIKFIENGFRNSFATFALSYNGLQGLDGVARQMGNTAEIIRRHYMRNLPAGSGRAWFSLRPFEVVSSAAASA